MATSALTPKQQKFVNEYLVDLNASAAARRAGYSERTANPQASRLLVNVNVATDIQLREVELAKATDVTPEKVVKELGRLAFSDMRNYATWGPDGV